MDGLPIALQSLIYGEAGVYGVCTLARSEVLRTALITDQRDIEEDLGEDKDRPPDNPTWRIAAMAGGVTGLTEARLGAALQRLGQRLGRLKHISLHLGSASDASPPGAHGRPKTVVSGLLRFVQHVVPELGSATRLTIRGHQPALPARCEALPWQLLARTRLGAACTRLDVTSDDRTIALLLNGLVTSFPAMREVHVQCRSNGARDIASGEGVIKLRAPDSMTRLTVHLRSDSGWDPALNRLCLYQALGLEELSCRVVGSQRRWESAVVQAHCDLPVLRSLLWDSFLVVDPQRPLPALRRARVRYAVRYTVPPSFQAWLLQLKQVAPSLTDLMVWLIGLPLRPAELVDLKAWAAVSLPFALSHVAGC